MRLPSIALPTGPYDWHPERTPRDVYEVRVAQLRTLMAERGVTHAVVHGNTFDHDALLWLTHFTPKLGPAYALIPAYGPLRLLFAGGPGMKPSAQKLTWVEDVAAIKSIEGDAKRWLDETAAGKPVRLGLVEGSSMLRCDYRAILGVAGNSLVEFDADITARIAPVPGTMAAIEILALARREISRNAKLGADLRVAIIGMERAAYAGGAQDVRVMAGRRPDSPPTSLPDEPPLLSGPTWICLFVRADGAWASERFLLNPTTP